MFRACVLLLAALALAASHTVDYSGYKVLKVVTKSQGDIDFLLKLRSDYGVDLWNEPGALGATVLFHVKPSLVQAVEDFLVKKDIEHDVVFYDLQSTIAAEKVMHAPTNVSQASSFDFGKYNQYSEVEAFIKSLPTEHPGIVKLETIGNSYENRPIYKLVISSGNSPNKPAIMMECGIHAREWSSVAACCYFVNQLVTDDNAKPLLEKNEFHIVVESNPDGYVYTWTGDRMWRKTRSQSSMDWMQVCRGADANRNFDIEHCGVGTSRKPCDEIYCGDYPFSESEARALRDLMAKLEPRLKAYFSLHAFSQLWMTPYGIHKNYPTNYNELLRVGQVGADALAKSRGTRYRVGSIANIIYEAAGSSVDYAYLKHNVKMAFALELPDEGRYGFFLPVNQILPMCQETYDGLIAAIQAIP